MVPRRWIRFAVCLRDGDAGNAGEAELVILVLKCTETNVCQIVENAQNIKNDHILFCGMCR